MRTLIAQVGLLVAAASATLALGLSTPAQGEVSEIHTSDTYSDNYIAVCAQAPLNFYTWDEAQAYCMNNHQTTLASIHGVADVDEIVSLLVGIGPPDPAWVGGFENPSDSEIFEWVDGTPWDYDPDWAIGEPDPGEDFVAIHPVVGLLVDKDNSSEYTCFVCNRYEVSGVEEDLLPVKNMLLGATPNPFNPSTKLSFEIAVAGHVRLDVYDLAGRLVATLVDETRGIGRYEEIWNGRDGAGRMLSAGTYLYRLEAGNYVETKRVTLLK